MTHPGLARAFRVLSYVFRALALAMSALTLVLCLGSAANLGLLSWTQAVQALLPQSLAGVLVVPTLVGGAFRGDFFIAAVVLFVLDWACVRAASALR